VISVFCEIIELCERLKARVERVFFTSCVPNVWNGGLQSVPSKLPVHFVACMSSGRARSSACALKCRWHFGLMCLAVLSRVLTSATLQPPKCYTCGAMHFPQLGTASPWCEGDVVAGERWARHTWTWGPQHGTLALRGGREVRVGGREVCLSHQHCRALPCQYVNAFASANWSTAAGQVLCLKTRPLSQAKQKATRPPKKGGAADSGSRDDKPQAANGGSTLRVPLYCASEAACV
jgi:hypothetical protein